MPANEHKVAFYSLPPKVKVAVEKIIDHNIKVGLWESAVALASLKGAYQARLKLTAILLIVGATALKMHGKQFRQEYLQLFRALKAEKDNPAIKGLVEKYPFLVVKINGALIGKKRAPHIRRLPIGRRRVVSPKAGKPAIRKWRKRYLPK